MYGFLLASDIPESIKALILQFFQSYHAFQYLPLVPSDQCYSLCPQSTKHSVISLTMVHPSSSISLADIKILINLSHGYAPVVGYDSHQTLANVADLVVVVQELDVGFHCCLGIFGSGAIIG